MISIEDIENFIKENNVSLLEQIRVNLNKEEKLELSVQKSYKIKKKIYQIIYH